MDAIKYILLDIEGTVCPISFVKDTLFPYAIKALPGVLAAKWDDPDFQPYRDAFPPGVRDSQVALQAHVEDLTARDVKIAALKNLQGYLWQEGYESGNYATPLFPDVAPQLKRWRDAGLELAIYSSGSVFAQKLLFAHVDGRALPLSKKHRHSDDATVSDEAAFEHAGPAIKRTKVSGDNAQDDIEKPDAVAATVLDYVGAGPSVKADHVEDLTGLFGGWFDTTNAGPKTESKSYNKILAAMNWPPSRTLFLSDNTKEVDAAAIASIRAVLVERPGNEPVPEFERQRLGAISSLDELSLPDEKGQRSPSAQPQSAEATSAAASSKPPPGIRNDASIAADADEPAAALAALDPNQPEPKAKKVVTASEEPPIERIP